MTKITKKFTIILDIDDTTADTCASLLFEANSKFGTNYKKEDIFDWNLDTSFPGKNMCQFFEQENFFLNLKPMDGAVHYTKKLIEDGFEIIITTASPINGFKDKALWMQKHLPHIPEKNLILAWRKEVVKGDIMLDDALHNITTSICKYPIVFAQPWNKNTPSKYRRVSSWKEFYELVHDLYNLEQDWRRCSIDNKAI